MSVQEDVPVGVPVPVPLPVQPAAVRACRVALSLRRGGLELLSAVVPTHGGGSVCPAIVRAEAM